MDNIYEQLVQKKRTTADTIKIVAISVGSTAAAAACVIAGLLFGLAILWGAAIGIIVLCVWLINGMKIEYEYILTNNEMDIDKIIGRRKRKRMITVDLSKAEDLGKYPSKTEAGADTTVYATTGLEQNAHYLLVQHKDYDKVKVIFNPNEKLREAIAHEVPGSLRERLKNDVE